MKLSALERAIYAAAFQSETDRSLAAPPKFSAAGVDEMRASRRRWEERVFEEAIVWAEDVVREHRMAVRRLRKRGE